MTSVENSQVHQNEIAGFWRRAFAFFLDILVLGLVGWVIGLYAFDFLVKLGGWGRLIGFVIALLYFSLLDSRLFLGQSFGKLVMKIKVVQQNGEPLSLAASFVRTAIFCVPYFLNDAFNDVMSTPILITSLLSILVLGFGVTIIYLLIFNRTTRQSLHDIAVGAYVVRASAENVPLVSDKLWRGHVLVAALLMVFAAAAPGLTIHLAKTEPFTGLLSLQQALMELPGVQYASVSDAMTTNYGGNGSNSSTSLLVKLVVDSNTIDQEALADQAVRLAFSNYPATLKRDAISVSFTYGYDIGIASAWHTERVVHSVVDWRKRLAPAPVAIPAPTVVPDAVPTDAPTSAPVSKEAAAPAS